MQFWLFVQCRVYCGILLTLFLSLLPMAAADLFKAFKSMLNSPPRHHFDVTPNDGTDLATVTRGIYVGVSGNVKITNVSGDTVTYTNLAAGVHHPMCAARIWSTGTTATGIIGVY